MGEELPWYPTCFSVQRWGQASYASDVCRPAGRGLRRDTWAWPSGPRAPPPVRASHDVRRRPSCCRHFPVCVERAAAGSRRPTAGASHPRPRTTSTASARRSARNRRSRLEDHRLKFYVEIIARWPTFQDYIGKYADLMNGPVRGSGMTHADFLGIVTPQHVRDERRHQADRGAAVFDRQLAGPVTRQESDRELPQRRDESDLRRIRQRIEEELASLRGKGGAEKNRVVNLVQDVGHTPALGPRRFASRVSTHDLRDHPVPRRNDDRHGAERL